MREEVWLLEDGEWMIEVVSEKVRMKEQVFCVIEEEGKEGRMV